METVELVNKPYRVFNPRILSYSVFLEIFFQIVRFKIFCFLVLVFFLLWPYCTQRHLHFLRASSK